MPSLPPQVGKGRVVKITGIANKGRTATVLLRGSNKLVSGGARELGGWLGGLLVGRVVG